jgi:hypothetical protein
LPLERSIACSSSALVARLPLSQLIPMFASQYKKIGYKKSGIIWDGTGYTGMGVDVVMVFTLG